jgi:hypothetical protein
MHTIMRYSLVPPLVEKANLIKSCVQDIYMQRGLVHGSEPVRYQVPTRAQD